MPAPLRHTLSLLIVLVSAAALRADVYELRTYTTMPDKLDKLNARFRDHTVKLFKKYGIESMGYWVPTDEEKSQNTLIYVIKHKSRDAAKASWKAFLQDPEWQAAAKASGVGRLATRPESVYMTKAPYSPKTKAESAKTGKPVEGVFELRVYKAAPGKLGKLDARFRDHTIRLFAKHGMESIAYWHPTEKPAADHTLIYILRHKSADAAKESWAAFGRDPEWRAAAKASGVGRLAEPPKATYMKATDYSAIQ